MFHHAHSIDDHHNHLSLSRTPVTCTLGFFSVSPRPYRPLPCDPSKRKTVIIPFNIENAIRLCHLATRKRLLLGKVGWLGGGSRPGHTDGYWYSQDTSSWCFIVFVSSSCPVYDLATLFVQDLQHCYKRFLQHCYKSIY